MSKRKSPLDRIQDEMDLEEKKADLKRTTDILNKATELPKERELGSALKSISGHLEEDVEEIKADAKRMFTAVQTLKAFSKQLREQVEEPLEEAVHEFRKRNKILSEDGNQTRRSVLSTMSASDRIRQEQAKSLGTQEDLAKVRKVKEMISDKGGEIKPEEVLKKAFGKAESAKKPEEKEEEPEEEGGEGEG